MCLYWTIYESAPEEAQFRVMALEDTLDVDKPEGGLQETEIAEHSDKQRTSLTRSRIRPPGKGPNPLLKLIP